MSKTIWWYLLILLMTAGVEPVLGQNQPSLDGLSRSIARLAADIEPAVVQIFTAGYAGLDADPNSGAYPFSRRRGSGSGVLVSGDGYIVTNAHVVSNARRIQVLIREPDDNGASVLRSKGRLMEAELVGTDAETDVAVLRLDLDQTPFLKFGDSEALTKGQIVLAFGSPLGLENSVSLGVVSAVARQMRPDDPMIYIQTDAPINPGNSGGALVNARGELVGINTFILSQSGGNEGIGFAAPANIVSHVYEEIRRRGSVRRSHLGLELQTITPLLAQGLALDVSQGAIVSDVAPGGPAERAGLRIGDIVLRLGDKIIENARQLEVNVYSREPGESVQLQVLRGSEVLNLSAGVIERRDPMSRLAALVTPEDNLIAPLGILALDLSADIARLLPPPRKFAGVLVAALVSSGPIGDNSLQAGDVIHQLNGREIIGLRPLREELAARASGDTVVLQVARQQRLMYVALLLQ